MTSKERDGLLPQERLGQTHNLEQPNQEGCCAKAPPPLLQPAAPDVLEQSRAFHSPEAARQRLGNSREGFWGLAEALLSWPPSGLQLAGQTFLLHLALAPLTLAQMCTGAPQSPPCFAKPFHQDRFCVLV